MSTGPSLRSSEQTTALFLCEEHNRLQEKLNYLALQETMDGCLSSFSLAHSSWQPTYPGLFLPLSTQEIVFT